MQRLLLQTVQKKEELLIGRVAGATVAIDNAPNGDYQAIKLINVWTGSVLCLEIYVHAAVDTP